MADLDTLGIDILDALSKFPGQVEGSGHNPALLAGVLDHVLASAHP